MNHFEPQAAVIFEEKARLLRSERKTESKQLRQLQMKLQGTAHTEKSIKGAPDESQGIR
jgi:hypothetical protein